MNRAAPGLSIEDLTEYAGHWPGEAEVVAHFIELLGDVQDPFLRERAAGHFTASC